MGKTDTEKPINVFRFQSHALFSSSCLLPVALFPFQGVANRGASVRVGRDTEKEGKGETQRLVAGEADGTLSLSVVC
jgi:hypothetical protein